MPFERLSRNFIRFVVNVLVLSILVLDIAMLLFILLGKWGSKREKETAVDFSTASVLRWMTTFQV